MTYNQTIKSAKPFLHKPLRKDYLIFGSPKIEDDEIAEVVETLKSGWIGTGKRCHAFEEMFRQYKGTDHAVAVNSCTAGLFLALLVSGIKKGDEVLVPTMTFCATANIVEHLNAKPVLVDCDPITQNVSIADLMKKRSRKTKAMILVHFAGRGISNIEEIVSYARKHNIRVIEDCAHAIETEINGKKAGTFGDIASFSFYVTKNITTAEGGMILTNNSEYSGKLKTLALHGMSIDAWKRFSDDGYKHYEVIYPGYKFNMPDLQAALGIKQFEKLDRFYTRRKEIWDYYNNELANLPVTLPAPELHSNKHALHLYTIHIQPEKLNINRDQLLGLLHRENIGTGVHYRALHLQKFYREKYKLKPEDFPNASHISETTLSIPLSPKLTDQDCQHVVTALKNILTFYAR